MFSLVAQAEGILATRSKASISPEGQLSISTRFNTELPISLQQVLIQGVPLYFDLNYRLNSPTIAAYKNQLKNLFGGEEKITYKLSFHPLTNNYRVSIGSFSSEYHALEAALKVIGSTSNWKVLSHGALEPSDSVNADIRLQLSTEQLPKPFQINALTSSEWNLDSGWIPLYLTRE